MNTLLIGYFGYFNAGDDAFIKTTQWASHNYDLNLTLSATSDKVFSSEHGTVKPIYSKFVPQRYDFNYRQYRFKQISNKFDLCLFAGGSNFHSSYSLKHWRDSFSNRKKQLICAIGVSIGPFKDIAAEHECKELLKMFDLIAVRDLSSFGRLVDMNLDTPYYKSNDIAVMISKTSQDTRLLRNNMKSNESIIGFSICDESIQLDDTPTYDQREFFINSIKRILDDNVSDKIMLFAFNKHKQVGDRAICTHILNSLPTYRERILYYEYDGNINNILIEMSKMKCFIGMRLHSIVFSYSLSIPFIMIPYHEKCYEFAKMIDIGRSNLLSADTVNPQMFIELIKSLDILDNTKAMSESELNFIYLSELINKC
jgi:polysaccharide pyruvyl transferase WcaK-like protein